jgi:hypothetical protein
MPRKPLSRARKPTAPRKPSSRARKPAKPRQQSRKSRKPATSRNPLTRVRKLALSLPEAHEVEAWGEPTFRVKNKLFAMYARANNHHGGGRNAVWCKARPVNQSLMIGASPNRFFSPPYVGPSGWVGVWLDGDVDWEELLDLLADGYRLTAPRKLLDQLKEL